MLLLEGLARRSKNWVH